MNDNIEKNLKSILKKWKFPEKIVQKYDEVGIKEIFDWQAEVLNNVQVSEEKRNLVYSAPTSAGKSLVAELFMLKNVLDWRRKAIMILPYVSLAKEKLKHLQFIASDSFLRVDGFIGSSSPGGGFASVDIAICTIEKANSLLNRLIEEENIFELGAIVIDELHMINDGSRGYLLELILSKIKYLCIKNKKDLKIQIIGMSATLPNLKVLSEWLDAILYQTNFRPVSLLECIKYETAVYDKNNEKVSQINVDSRIENDPDNLAQLVLETIVNRLGVLVFCPTKARCETIAEHLARTIYSLEKRHNEAITYLNKDKIIECLNELKNTPAGLDSLLSKTVRYGIAFHHAGLTMEEREILENHFKKGDLLVIVCTSTLSSGINFPARRVIIRTPIFNGRPIDPMNYKQMAGRAGRKGIDTCGESILMCSNANERKIAEGLLNIEQMPEANFASNLSAQSNETAPLNGGIKRALLETIVSGVASSKQEVIDYVSCFLSSRLENGDSYEKYLKWLNQNQFIDMSNSGTVDETYKPTQLAYAVVAAAMSPDEGLVIFGELQKALQCFVLENELHIIYQITPINICDYWVSSSSSVDWNLFYTMHQSFSPDFRRVSDLVGVRQSFLMKMIKGSTSMQTCDQKLLKVHLRFFTSLILNDLVNETPFSTILTKYGCQKGFLQTLQQSASTYSAMITVFCNRLGWFNLEILVNQFQSRLTFGVQRQLVDLVRIKLLNSHRARLFYNAGLTTIASLAMCDIKKCEKILRSGLTFVGAKTLNQKEEEVNSSEAVIYHEGKGYTYWQAATMILEEANQLLREDLEQLGVKISKAEENENATEDTKALNKTNKSIFHFDDTVDSILVQQSQAAQKSQPEIVQVKTENNIVTETDIKDEQSSDVKIESSSESINRGIEALKIEDQPPLNQNTSVDMETNSQNSQLDETHIILKAVEKFEKIQSNSAAKTTPKNLNMTVVSQEVLNMCDVFEKNALSGSKKNKTPTQRVKKSLNYSFGDRTLKNILNSPTSPTNSNYIDNGELKQIFATQLPPNNENSNTEKLEILDFFKTLNLTSLNINVINNITELKKLSTAIKAKSMMSMSLVCMKVAKDTENQIAYSDYYDEKKDCYFRLFGIFMCIESEKLEQVNLILVRKDNEYLRSIRELLQKDELTKVMFYAQKHAKILKIGIDVNLKSPCYDPIVASWLLNQDILTIYQISQKYAANLKFPIDALFKTSKSCFGCYNRLEVDRFTALKGALIECLIALSCFDKLKLQLQLENTWIYFGKVESEVVLLSARIELIGLGLNSNELERTKALLLEKKKEIEDRACVYAGKTTINLNSPDEIAFVLFNKLKLKPPGTDERAVFIGGGTDKVKHHSTSKEVLLQLASQHDFPKLVILWRKINYALSNCIFPIEREKIFDDSLKMYRIHPSIDLYTVTGRMNFFNPCLQNIPRDFEITTDHLLSDNCLQIDAASNNAELFDEIAAANFLDKISDNLPTSSSKSDGSISLRNAFIPSEDRILLAADYCQLELRIITNLCRDETLISIFNDSVNDVFNLLASKWLNLPVEQIDDVKRQNVKKVIYGIIYGISAKTLSIFLGLSENEASQFIDSFKCTFPGLKNYIIKQIDHCRVKGYVETIRKRRRYLPNISNLDQKQRAQAERQAVNTMVQGSASDLVKSAMIKIEKTLRKKYRDDSTRGASMVMQLHDELIYEVNKKDLNDVKSILKDCMENCMDLPVKMKIKMKSGSTWGSLSSV